MAGHIVFSRRQTSGKALTTLQSSWKPVAATVARTERCNSPLLRQLNRALCV